MDINLGENLKTLRIRSRRTLEDVAEIIDVSRQSVSKWESGESYPDIEKCVRLSKLYNVSLDALINKPLEELINEDGKKGQIRFRTDGSRQKRNNQIAAKGNRNI